MKSKTSRLQIVFDFDGVMSGGMYFNESGKELKHLQYCIRYAINMLNHFDCDCYVLSGDSTEHGQAITKAMLDNVNIKRLVFCNSKQKLLTLHQMFGDLTKICYIADDLYDILVAPQCGVFCTNALAMKQLQIVADYVSPQTNRDYFVLDVANWIVSHILQCMPEWYCQYESYNSMSVLRRFELFNTNKVLIVGKDRYKDPAKAAEFAMSWFNKSNLSKLLLQGHKYEHLSECYNMQYIALTELNHFSLDWQTFAIIMPDVINLDFARFLNLTKTLINFDEPGITYEDFRFFFQNVQRAINLLDIDNWYHKQFFLYLNEQTQADWLIKLIKGPSIEAPTIGFAKSCVIWYNKPNICK